MSDMLASLFFCQIYRAAMNGPGNLVLLPFLPLERIEIIAVIVFYIIT